MLFQWIISLPMMLCFFWSIFFALRFHRGSKEPRVTGSILLFYLAATILYTDHWLYFSDHPSFLGEWSYSIVNLCVYPLYYAYLRALTRTKISFEVPLLLLPAAVVAIVFPLNVRFHWGGEDLIPLIARLCFAAQVVWVLVRGYRLIRNTQRRLDNNYTDDRSYLLQPTHTLLLFVGFTAFVSMLLNRRKRSRRARKRKKRKPVPRRWRRRMNYSIKSSPPCAKNNSSRTRTSLFKTSLRLWDPTARTSPLVSIGARISVSRNS